jgi:hypothetical protein
VCRVPGVASFHPEEPASVLVGFFVSRCSWSSPFARCCRAASCWSATAAPATSRVAPVRRTTDGLRTLTISRARAALRTPAQPLKAYIRFEISSITLCFETYFRCALRRMVSARKGEMALVKSHRRASLSVRNAQNFGSAITSPNYGRFAFGRFRFG